MSLNIENANSLVTERAKILVNQLIKHRGHDMPPFLAEEYAKITGIKRIEKADLGQSSGVLLRLAEGQIIKVNQKDSIVRQNFSCAHEIGHILFNELKLAPYLREAEFRNPKALGLSTRIKERLCDTVAKELLMPEKVFIKYLSNLGVSINTIEYLSRFFCTSIQTTAIRVAEISNEHCIILVWRKTGNKSQTLRLVWRVGPGGKSIGYNDYIPLQTRINHVSKLYEAFQTDNLIKGFKLFKINNAPQRLLMESKGFSFGEKRFVISLAFLNR